ncbi:MAG: transcriptional regulator, MerR family [Sedimentibacter sp.]|jgi:DNA-binding transcriptional MerR regulator|nr:transcriptional regulator, MerR family [Sedimentibacter sp.]
MNSDERIFSVGEVARSTGLTVRTLQYYDNIGILPTSGRTESGRRYYTEKDIIKLEQIVFYKSLGISLQEIKEELVDSPTPKVLEQMLSSHMDILLRKISSLNLAISIIDVSVTEIRSGNSLPWETLTNLIRTMEGSSLKDWANYDFDSMIYDSLKMKNITTKGTIDIYLSIRSLLAEAAMLSKIGHDPSDTSAQVFAKRWWEFIMSITGGDESVISAFDAVNKNRDEWPEVDRELYRIAEPFIEKALGIYIMKNNITVPASLK